MGIPEYWLVDDAALGERRFIATPKQLTVSVYAWVAGVYELAQFRIGEQVKSPLFPELELIAEQILQAGV